MIQAWIWLWKVELLYWWPWILVPGTSDDYKNTNLQASNALSSTLRHVWEALGSLVSPTETSMKCSTLGGGGGGGQWNHRLVYWWHRNHATGTNEREPTESAVADSTNVDQVELWSLHVRVDLNSSTVSYKIPVFRKSKVTPCSTDSLEWIGQLSTRAVRCQDEAILSLLLACIGCNTCKQETPCIRTNCRPREEAVLQLEALSMVNSDRTRLDNATS